MASLPTTPTSSRKLLSSLPGTPTPSRKPRHGDRFIPVRAGNTWDLSFFPLTPPASTPGSKSTSSEASGSASRPLGSSSASVNKDLEEEEEKNVEKPALYSSLLQTELLGVKVEECKQETPEKRVKLPAKRRLFHYDSTERVNIINSPWSQYSTTPISKESETLIQKSSHKPSRKISKTPFKVLDAPELGDDFYLNLLDWSSQNCIAVGLGSCVYLWSACNAHVTRLCDLSRSMDSVTSVAWNERGSLVAVGTHTGLVQIYDATSEKLLTTILPHAGRVGTLAWNFDLITSGSKDAYIHQRDIRVPLSARRGLYAGHSQEICGLKWSPDHQLLASGGNDNRLLIWNMHSDKPILSFREHQAAIKAIGWSPHHHGLLASGGGTADKCVRFWSTVTGQAMQVVPTGSQVCNLIWSKNSNEFVTTHGYSQNQILVWKYPSLQQIAELKGHLKRVLYLSMSPDGENIVTGAGDETLRFWNVFKKGKSQKENSTRSPLNLYSNLR